MFCDTITLQQWPARNLAVYLEHKAKFVIQEQGGHFVFHNAPLFFRHGFSTESLAVFHHTHYRVPRLKLIHPSNTGFHPLVRVAPLNLLTGYLPSSIWLRKIFYTEAWHKSLKFMTTTLPLPEPWCATLISLRTSTSPGQSLLDAPKYARKPFHWQLKIGCGCQNPTKSLAKQS